MKCIVLDYERKELLIFTYDDSEDIEEVLTERYGFSLGNINYMTVHELRLSLP